MPFTKGHRFYSGSEKGWIKKGAKLSEETRRRMSETRKRLGIRPPSPKGRKMSAEARKNMSLARLGKKGRPLTDKEKSYLSEIHRGEKSHLWRGGITPVNRAIRVSFEYRLWRKKVLERDNRTCVLCGSKDRIEVDHVKAFADYPELRFEIDNGRVLCNSCHVKTDNYGWNRYNKRKVKYARVT